MEGGDYGFGSRSSLNFHGHHGAASSGGFQASQMPIKNRVSQLDVIIIFDNCILELDKRFWKRSSRE